MKEKKKIEVQVGFGPSPRSAKEMTDIGESMVKHSATILPPPKDGCQECGAKHESGAPHNRDSMFYQMAFRQKHGRWPTWADAIAHCSEEIRADIKEFLEAEGLWSEPIEGMADEEKAARAVGGLPTHSTKPDGGKYFMEVIEIENEESGAWDEEETDDESRP